MREQKCRTALPPLVGLLISVLFWGCLGLTGIAGALLILSPRFLEFEQLRLRTLRNGSEIHRLDEQTRHLSHVAEALRDDPDYMLRVAATELHTTPQGELRVPVDRELEYDSRVPVSGSPGVLVSETAWYRPYLENLSGPSELRTRLMLATAVLTGFTFACLNEAFFCGWMGVLLGSWATSVGGRYVRRSASSVPDNSTTAKT